MNNKNTFSKKLTFLFVLLVFSLRLSAQLQIFTVRNKNYSSISYELAFNNFDGRNLLEAKGYDKNNINRQPANIDADVLKSGFYVIVKCIRKDYNGELISYGIGGSKTSYEIAQKLAVINLSAYDWNWLEKNGYDVVDKNTFEIKTDNQSFIATVFYNKDAAGNKTIKNALLQSKTISDDDYNKWKSKFSNNNANTEVYVSRLIVSKGKAAVVKCIKMTGKIVTESFKLIYAATNSNYNITLWPEGTITNTNETDKFIMVKEMSIEITSPSLMDEAIGSAKKTIRLKVKDYQDKENKLNKPNKLYKKTKTAATGVRG